MRDHLIGWVYLDFKKKIFYIRKEKVVSSWSVPATQEESRVFKRNFLEKGKKTCTFKEFQEYSFLDGRRKNSRIYGTIQLSETQFSVLMEIMEDKEHGRFSDALTFLVQENHKLRNFETEDRKTVQKLLKTISQFTENLSKVIVKI